jgi:hypothetical protein
LCDARVDLLWVQRDFLALALDPWLGESGGEEGGAVEDQTVEVIALVEGDEDDVRVASLEQAAGVEVVGQGYGFVGRWES